MIKEVKRVKKGIGVFVSPFIVFLICLLENSIVINYNVFAEVISGGGTSSVTAESCGDPNCYNDATWVHYKIKDGKTSGVIGKVPGYMNKGGGGGDIPGQMVGAGCASKGNGVWVLQQVSTLINGNPTYRSFGIFEVAHDDFGIDPLGSNDYKRGEGNCPFGETSLRCYLRDDVPFEGPIEDTYDTDVFEYDYNIARSNEEIADYYEKFEGDTWDPSGLNKETSWFCGGPDLGSDKAVATFDGWINLKLNPSMESTSGCSGATEGNKNKEVTCNLPGIGPIGSASDPVATGYAVIKSRKANPTSLDGVASTKYVFPNPSGSVSAPGMSSGAIDVGPFEHNQKKQPLSTKDYGGVINVEPGVQRLCYNLSYYGKVKYEKSGGGSWQPVSFSSAKNKYACVNITNYGTRSAELSATSSAVWKDHTENPALIRMDESHAYIQSEKVENGKIYSTFTNPPTEMNSDGTLPDSIKDVTATYTGEFKHEIKLIDPDGIRAWLAQYPNGERTVEINYTVEESDDGVNFSPTSESGTLNFGDGASMSSEKQILVTQPVVVKASETSGKMLCQRVHFTNKLSYVTENAGLKRIEVSEDYSAPACVYLGLPESKDETEDFNESFYNVKSDTDDGTISFSNSFQRGGGDDTWRMLSVDSLGFFQHKLWIEMDDSANTYKENVVDGVSFVSQGDPGSVKNYRFETDYVGHAYFEDGSASRYLSPANAGGRKIVPASGGVDGFGLDFQITTLEPFGFGIFGGASGVHNGSVTDVSSGYWRSDITTGGTSVKLGGDVSATDALAVLAGEDKTLDVKTINTPSRWKAVYKRAVRVTNVNGASTPETRVPYKIFLEGIETIDSSEDDSDQVAGIKVHRDYNFKIQNFKLADVEGANAFGGKNQAVVAGQKSDISFNFEWTRADSSIWNSGEPDRNYLTDVFHEKTRAYLVSFEFAPGAGRSEISSLVNGEARYKGSGSGSLPTEVSDLKGWVEGKLGVSVSEWDSSLILSDNINDPFRQNSIRGRSVYQTSEQRINSNTTPGMQNFSYTYNDAQVSENAAVGGKYCFGIYIENAMNDQDGVEVDNSGSALLSEIACANVVKKPSMEVWGGDVASNGGIQTSTTRTEISPAGAYGSWGDFGIIANKKITGMSSGRSIVSEGRGSSNTEIGLGRISPLTIANANRGEFGDAKIDGLDDSIFEELKSRYNCETYPCTMSNGVRVTNDLGELYGSSITDRIVLVYDSGLTIDNNIILDSDNGGTRYGNESGAEKTIPQVLIISEGPVTIKNTVEQVDAWIISKLKVDTCSVDSSHNVVIGDGDTLDPSVVNESMVYVGLENCKAALTVNGPIIGSQLAFDRTFGENPNGKIYVPGNADPQDEGQSLGESAEKN